jgi:NAD(P)-dependent dehydrogenase (short-subunit alcohol dehydrogenase family)
VPGLSERHRRSSTGLTGWRKTSEDGHELTWQANYLAPFLLQSLLHDRLAASRANVVVTSSSAHSSGRIRLDDLEYEKRSYYPAIVYSATKLANLLFSREIARRAPRTGITSVAFHPGTIDSDFGREARGVTALMYKTRLGRRHFTVDTEEGAQPLITLAGLPDPHKVNGQYFDRLKPNARTFKQTQDTALGAQLWETTAKTLGLPATT